MLGGEGASLRIIYLLVRTGMKMEGFSFSFSFFLSFCSAVASYGPEILVCIWPL